MKRKNWMLNLLLAMIVLPCLVLLSACGEADVSENGSGETGARITGVSVYIGDNLVADDNKTINVTYGDTVNLEERITVKLTYDDNTTKTITKGTDGYTLTGVPDVFNAGSYNITISYGEYTGIQITLVVAKATPSTPSARTGVFGNRLSSVALPEGWTWDAPNTLLDDSGNYKASYIGTTNYNAVTAANVAVTVTGERAEGVVARLGLGEIAGLTEETFKNWVVNNYFISIGNADLTETQFNALIAHLNDTYNEGALEPLPAFTGTGGRELYDENDSDLSYLDLDDGVDYEYICNNAGGEHYFIQVAAYQIGGEGNIHLIGCEISVQSPYNGAKLVNVANKNDIIEITFDEANNTTGSVTWGELSGTYTITGDNFDVLNVTFSDDSTATGTIDMENVTVQITYNAVEYNFKELTFEVDTTTGMLYRAYEPFNVYKTNQKVKMTISETDEGMESKSVVTEWKVGTSSFMSVKQEVYNAETSELILSYEEIYDISDEKVYLFYSDINGQFSKTLTFAQFMAKLQTIDPSIESIEEEMFAKSASAMFFATFMGEGEDPAWDRQDFIDNISGFGRTKIDGFWYDIEAYDRGSRTVKFIVKDDKIGIGFEGGTYIFADLNFTNYPTYTRTGYTDWADAALDAKLAQIYEGSGGGESGGSGQEFTSASSDDSLFIDHTSSSGGDFTWGSLSGTFTLSQQDPPSAIMNLTIQIVSGGEGTITGTFDTSTNTIAFTYNETSYTFTAESHGGEGGGESGGEGGGEPSTPTALFDGVDLPANFKAVWTGFASQTHTIVKVGEDVYQEVNGSACYYKKQLDGTYVQYNLNEGVWVAEADALSVDDVKSEMAFSSYFKKGESLSGTGYNQSEPALYETTSTDCRVYEMEIEGVVASVIYLYDEYDLLVAQYNGSSATGTLLIGLTSFDTSKESFADYGINDLPA